LTIPGFPGLWEPCECHTGHKNKTTLSETEQMLK